LAQKFNYGETHNFAIELNATYDADADVEKINEVRTLTPLVFKDYEATKVDATITPGVRDNASQEFTID
jgi:hypothetical protein